MFKTKNKLIHAVLILFIILSTLMAFSQFEPDSKPTPQREEEVLPPAKDSIFQEIPTGYWIKFNAFKTVSIIIVTLAFILGFVIYIQGLNAGGRVNRKEIRKSIIYALVIAIFARPVSINAHYYLGLGLSYILPQAYAYGIAGFIVYILWMVYIIAIPVYLYETFVVSAKEAYPVGERR
ncbi:MAG: hypothetical protein JSW07_20325 [bacterium]|nr:MAG: hypothetical protein JSW07_20325 [bacterium]